jgi:4-hydroxy-2-oxoheptanedioate aldolase
MRGRVAIGLIGVALCGVSMSGQQSGHLNPMIDLLASKKPVFGVGVPTQPRAGGGNRGGAAAPTPTPPPAPVAPKTPAELAADALAYRNADYFFTAVMERNVEAGATSMGAFQDAIAAAGALSTTTPRRLMVPLSSKAPNISRADMPADPAAYATNIARQLNTGVSSVSFVEVDSAEELRLGIAAMRFKANGGIRPDDVGNAPKYWGITEAEYRRKADVWPLNPQGELVVWAIIETKEGLANVREIAQVPGLSVLVPGAGTLGGVFSTTGADGRRVRDDVAWEAAIQTVLAACKEFKLACGYPVSETDIETRMSQGFNVGILQAFNDSAFRAVAKGRQIGGR